MWHLIARSVNVDSIALHSVKRGKSDSITFKYDQTKMNQTGEFVQEKNCYSNPHEAYLNAQKLAGQEMLFLNPGSKFKTAAQTFARQVEEMGKRHTSQISKYLRLSHFNIHGLRKGSGTHAALGICRMLRGGIKRTGFREADGLITREQFEGWQRRRGRGPEQ